MEAVFMAASSVEELVEYRRRTGTGRLDECWDGTWHLSDPSRRHQDLAGGIYAVHREVLHGSGRGLAFISINVTDRESDWMKNHRCPDGAVILDENPGRWIGERDAAFLGGPDLLVEVLSPDDDTFAKTPFYGALGVRELLIVEQETSEPQLWRLVDGALVRTAEPVQSEVTGLRYARGVRCLEVEDPASGRSWKL